MNIQKAILQQLQQLNINPVLQTTETSFAVKTLKTIHMTPALILQPPANVTWLVKSIVMCHVTGQFTIIFVDYEVPTVLPLKAYYFQELNTTASYTRNLDLYGSEILITPKMRIAFNGDANSYCDIYVEETIEQVNLVNNA